MEFWISVSLLIYLVLMIGVGAYAQQKVETEEDYLVAGRSLPLWLAWGTLLATWFGAATVLGASSTARDEGMIGTIIDPFASGTALIFAGLLYARPMWERKLLTTGDLYRQAFGPKTEVTASVVQSVGYLPWIAAQYVALGNVIHHYYHIPLAAGILIAAVFTLFLTMSGGMWSVTLTDTLQIMIVLVTLAILFFVMMAAFGEGSVTAGFKHTWESTPPEHRTLLPEFRFLGVVFWFATWMNGVLGNVPGQDLMQRVFASKDSKTASRACILAGVIYLVFGMLPVWLGLGSRLILPEYEGDGILFALADKLLSTPMTCLFVVSVVSIVVSTSTSALLAPATLVGHNLLGRMKSLKLSRLAIDRTSVLLVSLCALPIAFAGSNILDLLGVAFEIALVGLFVPFTFGVFGKPQNEWSGLLAIIFGTTVWLVHRAVPWPEGSLPTLVPFEFAGTFASLIGFYLGRLVPGQPPKVNVETAH